MSCKGCDREVTIGELMEFHAENYPDEDQSLRESVLRKMEAEEEFDEAEDTFLNEVLTDYAQRLESPEEGERMEREYEGPTEDDTVPEEELDVELEPEEEEELEAEVEEAEDDIEEDIENYDSPDAKDYAKTFAVFAVAAAGAVTGIYLTLKAIAALSGAK